MKALCVKMGIFVLLAVNLSFLNKIINEKNNQYLCKKINNGYEIIFFDKSCKKVFSESYPERPWISKITENILEIRISTGSPSSYVYYFNKENSRMSDVYFNPLLLENKYVAYMEDRTLILTDIFNEGLFYKEIERDFTRTADAISAIINVEVLDDGKVILEYYSGEDYVEKIEIIN